MAHLLKLCVLLCIVPVALCRLHHKEREKVCSRAKHCIWIDEFIKKKHGMPIRSTIEYGSYPDVYCYEGTNPYSLNGLLLVWHSLHINILTSSPEGMSLVLDNNTDAIIKSFKTNAVDDINTTEGIYLSPYQLHCIGMKHSGAVRNVVPYVFNAQLKLLPHFPIMLLVGVFLLFAAPSLSRNVTLYYGTGITLGIVASVLVVLYVFSKFVPKNNIIGLGILASGYTVIVSVFYWFMHHAIELSKAHWQYVIVYVLVAGLFSFAVLYRFGPVTNSRTFNLIQWGLQLVGVALLYFSSQMVEFSVGLVVSALLFYFIPVRYNPIIITFSWIKYVVSCILVPFFYCCKCLSFLNPLRLFWSKPTHRFLTEEEYEEQGHVETTKALNELRKYCKKNDVWETIGDLKDSKKFTRFLSGRSHVTQEEKVDHEWSFLTNDSEEDTFDYSDYEGHTPSPHPSASFNSSSRSSVPYASDESPSLSIRHQRHSYSHSPPHRDAPHYRDYEDHSPPHHVATYRDRGSPYHSPYKSSHSSSRKFDSPASSSRYGSRR